jgi:SAM-dependent methyltransferase
MQVTSERDRLRSLLGHLPALPQLNTSSSSQLAPFFTTLAPSASSLFISIDRAPVSRRVPVDWSALPASLDLCTNGGGPPQPLGMPNSESESNSTVFGHSWMVGRRAKHRARVALRQQLQSDPDNRAAVIPESSSSDVHGTATVRVLRKRAQVESFANIFDVLVSLVARRSDNSSPTKRLVAIDFGCGTGSLVLPLAYLFRDSIDFIAVDLNAQSLGLLERRAAAAELVNIRTVCSRIDEFQVPNDVPSVDIVTALHACGCATDHSIRFSRRHSAAFIVSPCCIGKIANDCATSDLRVTYPQSSWLRDAGCTEAEFIAMARIADHHDHAHTRNTSKRLSTGDRVIETSPSLPADAHEAERLIELATACKRCVELDRACAAAEDRYDVWPMALMHPEIAPSNKQDLVIGAPSGLPVAEALGKQLLVQ